MDNRAIAASRRSRRGITRRARSGIDAGLDARSADVEGQPHTVLEDVYALCVGTALLSLGLIILAKGGLVTGGAAGLALMLSYLTGGPPGLFILLLTAPSLLLAARVMGRSFAAKTLVVSVGVLAMTALMPRGMEVVHVSGSFAALVGGSLIGMGALALARHRAATGGSGVVILWLFRVRQWNAGRTQLLVDGAVLLLSSAVIQPAQFFWSMLGLLATAGILYVWHRPGRYTGY